MKKVFLTLMVCAGLAACTSDDVVIGTTSDSAFNGGDLYLQVFISDVKDGGTRATGTTGEGNNSYANGDSDEYAVNDAEFYFYDKDGVFISRASVWDNGSETQTDGTSIEYTSGTMIVLKGLTSTQLPKYMVTILNKPSGFEDSNYDPANTLGELESKTVDGYMNGNYYIMSTSSYTDSTTDASGTTTATRSADGKNYFVTEIGEDNFCEEPITSSSDLSNAVQVYVERLAAKVEVDVASSLQGTTVEDDVTYYELDITVGGTANNEVSEEIEGEENESTTVSEGVDKVYVKFLGWKLNATARQSYIMKNIDDAWDGTSSWANSTWNVKDGSWNDATNYRSYWGKGTAYGTGSFPTSNIGADGTSNTDSDEASASTWLNDYLQYTSLKNNDDILKIGPADSNTTDGYFGYCAENTNVVDSEGEGANGIKDEYSSGITSVLLKAQAYSYDETKDSYSPLALVNYGGLYWTVDGFKDEVAREEVNYDIKNAAELAATELGEIYKSVIGGLVDFMEPELYCATSAITTSTTETPKTFDGSFLGLVDLQNGGVGIWPKVTSAKYSDDTTVDSSIATKWTAIEGEGYEAAKDLDKYYLYLKVTDKDAWDSSTTSSLAGIFDLNTTVTDAEGNTYYYLDDNTTLRTSGEHSYSLRQFFVRALEMEADETNDYFAGIIDADGNSVTTTSTAPNLYLDGLMYYSIPIEHLVSATESTGSTDPTEPSTESEATIVEGQYGVVRNHWYTISITGLSKLGRGISNEDAVIVPDPEGIDTWLLPAQVNINAWMKVNDQEVSL